VLDAGFDEASRSPYLVMELLPGGTLAAYVKERSRLTPQQTVQILQQVAKGLDAAHSLRDASGARTPLIHRDLKPENLLLVVRENTPPQVKILDFGISKLLSESRNMSTEIRGTPMYMACEQVSAEKLSPQTDIWALGLIAYFMLTGRSYWKSASDPEASLQALFMEIVMAPLVPASQRLAEQCTDIQLPEDFDAWLERCIDRVPECRFESASAAVIALAAALRVERAPAGPARAVASHVLSRTATIASPDVAAHPRASTAASVPALETSPRAPRRGLVVELRARPLLAALALSSLILAAGTIVFLWRDSEPGAAERAGSPLSPPPAEAAPSAPAQSPAQAVAAPAPVRPLPALPQPVVAPLPAEPAEQPAYVGEPEPKQVTRALRTAPPAAPQHPPAAAKRVEPRAPEKRAAPVQQPANGFDLR
jgi:serine/threonine-protein kinase